MNDRYLNSFSRDDRTGAHALVSIVVPATVALALAALLAPAYAAAIVRAGEVRLASTVALAHSAAVDAVRRNVGSGLLAEQRLAGTAKRAAKRVMAAYASHSGAVFELPEIRPMRNTEGTIVAITVRSAELVSIVPSGGLRFE